MVKELRILMVGDSEDVTRPLVRELKRAGYDPSFELVETAQALRAALAEQTWDIILDHSPPKFNHLQALGVLKETSLKLPFIIVSGTIDEDVVVEAMRAGAHDYVMNDNLVRLVPAIERELKQAEERRERRRVEEALRESEETYRTIVEVSPDAIIVSGNDETITNVSNHAVEMLGYDSDGEIVGINVFDIFAPEDREKAAENRQMRFEGRAPRFVEYTMLKKDGTRFEIELGATAFHGSTGDPKGVIGIARDITQRKEYEESLRESEERYRNLFESSKDGIVVAGLEGKIIEANRAYLNMLGYTLDEVREISYERLTPKKWHQKEMGIVRDQISKRGYSEEYEREEIRKDGRIVPVSIRRWLITDEHGKPIGMCAIVRDVTERKRAERELQKAKTELEEFAHSVSHDLRGPLFASGLAVQILQELYKSPRTDENLEYMSEAIATIDHNISKSNALIEDLLSHAKGGMKPAEVADVDVGTVVQTVLEERAGAIAEKGIEVVVAADLGHVVASDTQIYQIFANLIGNAVKYIDSASPVIEISYLGDDGKGGHRYLVRDNGYGIPPEHLDKVFIPFFTGETGGTGIGLSTVEKIVRTYEGEIKAYNDNGACFEFTIRDFQGDQTS